MSYFFRKAVAPKGTRRAAGGQYSTIGEDTGIGHKGIGTLKLSDGQLNPYNPLNDLEQNDAAAPFPPDDDELEDPQNALGNLNGDL